EKNHARNEAPKAGEEKFPTALAIFRWAGQPIPANRTFRERSPIRRTSQPARSTMSTGMCFLRASIDLSKARRPAAVSDKAGHNPLSGWIDNSAASRVTGL